MWIMTELGFFQLHAGRSPDELMVTSRLRADLKAQFATAIRASGEKIYRVRGRDFAYKTFLPKASVVEVMTDEINSVKYNKLIPREGMELKELAMAIWYAGLKAQQDEDQRLSSDVKLWTDREIIRDDKLP